MSERIRFMMFLVKYKCNQWFAIRSKLSLGKPQKSYFLVARPLRDGWGGGGRHGLATKKKLFLRLPLVTCREILHQWYVVLTKILTHFFGPAPLCPYCNVSAIRLERYKKISLVGIARATVLNLYYTFSEIWSQSCEPQWRIRIKIDHIRPSDPEVLNCGM